MHLRNHEQKIIAAVPFLFLISIMQNPPEPVNPKLSFDCKNDNDKHSSNDHKSICAKTHADQP